MVSHRAIEDEIDITAGEPPGSDELLSHDRVSFVGHGARHPAVGANNLAKFTYFGLSSEGDVETDLGQRGAELGGPHHNLNKSIATGVPTRGRYAETETLRGLFPNRKPVRSQGGERPHRTSELNDLHPRSQLVEPFQVTDDLIEPA